MLRRCLGERGMDGRQEGREMQKRIAAESKSVFHSTDCYLHVKNADICLLKGGNKDCEVWQGINLIPDTCNTSHNEDRGAGFHRKIEHLHGFCGALHQEVAAGHAPIQHHLERIARLRMQRSR
jgi:hypothetical protein